MSSAEFFTPHTKRSVQMWYCSYNYMTTACTDDSRYLELAYLE